jgi:hypothetical protein
MNFDAIHALPLTQRGRPVGCRVSDAVKATAMQDRFPGKTWIYWSQFIICGDLGLGSVILGGLFWTVTMKDALDKPAPEAGPPMVITGSCLLIVAALAAFNIISRHTSMIRCYRDGIECNLIGVSSLDRVPLVPGLLRLAWTILSVQGFRTQRWRIPWSQFAGADVSGIPMAYELTLKGAVTLVTTGRVTHSIAFPQFALKDDPQQVADVLNHLATDPQRRDELPAWPTLPRQADGGRASRFS